MAKQTLTVQLMHARTRIAELEAQLAGERTEHAESREACLNAIDAYKVTEHGLYEMIGELRAQVLDLEALLNAPKTIAPRTLPAHFAAAREAAMRLGRSVKVEA